MGSDYSCFQEDPDKNAEYTTPRVGQFDAQGEDNRIHGNIANRIVKSKSLVSEIPPLPNQIQAKIQTLSKEQPNLKDREIYKSKYPFMIYYCNIDSTQEFPSRKCVIYKFKDNGSDFLGYFEGTLKPNFEVDMTDCLIIFSNGSYFQGIAEGKGVYQNESSGLRYEGGWRNECPEGQGFEKNNKGTYQGQYLNGQKEGKGKFVWSDGHFYEGDFVKGHFEGKGVLKDEKDFYEYEGDFQSGEKHGYGVEKLKYQKYQGGFRYGMRSGKGKLTSQKSDSDQIKSIFQGFFNQNRAHGRGCLTVYESGKEKRKISGMWNRGDLILIDSNTSQ